MVCALGALVATSRSEANFEHISSHRRKGGIVRPFKPQTQRGGHHHVLDTTSAWLLFTDAKISITNKKISETSEGVKGAPSQRVRRNNKMHARAWHPKDNTVTVPTVTVPIATPRDSETEMRREQRALVCSTGTERGFLPYRTTTAPPYEMNETKEK